MHAEKPKPPVNLAQARKISGKGPNKAPRQASQNTAQPTDNRRVITIGRQPEPKDSPDGEVPKARRISPTDERMGMRDKPMQLGSGAYRVKPLVERLRDKAWLDPDANRRDLMQEAGRKLVETFYRAGLIGVGAQNLTRVCGGGGDPAYMTPLSETMANARQEFRRAWDAMDGRLGMVTHRGPARLCVAVLCQEMRFEDAARLYVATGSTEERTGAAKERLRIALDRLVDHWRIEPDSRRMRGYMEEGARPRME